MTPDVSPAMPPLTGHFQHRRRFYARLFWIALVGFGLISADVVFNGQLRQLDKPIAYAVKQNWNELALWCSAACTQFGELIWVLYFMFVICSLLLLRKRRRETALVLFAMAGEGVLIPLLKSGFHIERPTATSRFTLTTGYTYPSGHTAAAMTLAGITVYILCRTQPRKKIRNLMWLFVTGLSVLVGISLFYIGAHFMTDILGGWLFGTTWLAACMWFGEWWLCDSPRQDIPPGIVVEPEDRQHHSAPSVSAGGK